MFLDLGAPVATAPGNTGWKSEEGCEVEEGCEEIPGADSHWGSTLERKSPLLKLISRFIAWGRGARGAPDLRLGAALPRGWHEAITASWAFLYAATCSHRTVRLCSARNPTHTPPFSAYRGRLELSIERLWQASLRGKRNLEGLHQSGGRCRVSGEQYVVHIDEAAEALSVATPRVGDERVAQVDDAAYTPQG